MDAELAAGIEPCGDRSDRDAPAGARAAARREDKAVAVGRAPMNATHCRVQIAAASGPGPNTAAPTRMGSSHLRAGASV
jgi:hypothetical protein